MPRAPCSSMLLILQRIPRHRFPCRLNCRLQSTCLDSLKVRKNCNSLPVRFAPKAILQVLAPWNFFPIGISISMWEETASLMRFYCSKMERSRTDRGFHLYRMKCSRRFWISNLSVKVSLRLRSMPLAITLFKFQCRLTNLNSRKVISQKSDFWRVPI